MLCLLRAPQKANKKKPLFVSFLATPTRHTPLRLQSMTQFACELFELASCGPPYHTIPYIVHIIQCTVVIHYIHVHMLMIVFVTGAITRKPQRQLPFSVRIPLVKCSSKVASWITPPYREYLVSLTVSCVDCRIALQTN